MELAITADLHWGQNRPGDDATAALLADLRRQPPDVLLLGGDLGTSQHFDECLQLFQNLPCLKAVVPGNHDLWVTTDDARGDSLHVYDSHLPLVCQRYGYHYLDHAPLLLPEAGLAIVGSINWYDYSWSLDELRKVTPDWDYRLKRKQFTRGAHNDGRFVRWPLDDVRFTERVVSTLEKQLDDALGQVEHALVLTHHPAFYGLNFPRDKPAQGWDSLLWDALSGNRRLEEVLSRRGERIPLVFSGHTHRARANSLGPIRGHNIGGDYHFKRLLRVTWPELSISEHDFQAQFEM